MTSDRKDPLRCWAYPSYSPTDGRAAKSSEAPQGSYSAEGERWSVSDQLKAGANGTPSGSGNTQSWADIDRNRSSKVPK
jgi:hypothetical protein